MVVCRLSTNCRRSDPDDKNSPPYRSNDGFRAERLTEALADRLESLDVETELADRPAEEIIREICRDRGLDPKRMPVRPPQWDMASPDETDIAAPPAVGRNYFGANPNSWRARESCASSTSRGCRGGSSPASRS